MANILIPLWFAAFQYMNVPYKWGGNDFDGMDCSGLVVRALNDYWALNKIERQIPDKNAQMLYHWAKSIAKQSCEPGEDCLLFFGSNSRNITHVAIGMNSLAMIEAGGAGRDSLHLSLRDLARMDARVRMKPISNRGDLIAAYNIFL